MSLSPFDGPLGAGLFADPTVSALFSDQAEVTAMIRVEAALARAETRVGVIPATDGEALAAALETLAAEETIDPLALAAGAAGSAVATPALVAALRARLGPSLGQHLHWGATSQDIQDTALVLRLRSALEIVDRRLAQISHRLAALANAHRKTPCVGRTWGQHATPTAFGLIAASWLDPITRLRTRLREMRPRLLAVQFGGAAGSLSALGAAGVAVRDALASDLDLTPAAPWHAARDRIGELAGWGVDLAGALGKIGLDLSALAASEVREIRLGAAGGSSTMPQKQNPVGPQTLIAMARATAGHATTLQGAALHGHQRDGSAWLSEWLALPPLVASVAGAARVSEEIVAGAEPDAAAMEATLAASAGGVLAETASFALAAHMPRADAQALVKAAAREDRPLLDALAAATDAPVDWAAVGDWTRSLGAVDALIDQILTEAAAIESASDRR